MNDQPLNDHLIEMLRTMREAERDVFGALDPTVRDAPLREGDWSAKDHQAHLTAWKARQARRFDLMRRGEVMDSVAEGETDALNAELQAARAGWAWDEIVDEADRVSEELIGQVAATDPALITEHEQLLGGTYGNGAFHAMEHFGWLVERAIGVDESRVAEFVDTVARQVASGGLPDRDAGAAVYNVACFHALAGRLDQARPLLRDAFRLRPDLLDWARQDSDLEGMRDELDSLAGASVNR
jgi:hypothetical protein